MSHAVYQTPALILGTRNMKESNKLIIMYTKRFGLIYTSVQSVRELRSKMRFHTQRLSLVDIDLVEGKDIWKLTGIHEKYSSLSFVDTQWYGLLDKVANLVERLCNGEEKNNELWNIIESLYTYYKKNRTTIISFEILEIILVARILFSLGYWESDDIHVIQANTYTEDVFDWVKNNKIKIVKRINESLKDSQL